MQTLLTSTQMRSADDYTIAHKLVSSIDLMEAASRAFVSAFINCFPDRDIQVAVYCGTGNNGGDGLAIARLLKNEGYNAGVKIAHFNKKTSANFVANLGRAKEAGIHISEINAALFPPEDAGILIDALLGSGLNKPLQGDWIRLVNHLNSLKKTIVSVDIPTGIPAEDSIEKRLPAIRSKITISFQRPKLNFFFPESAEYIGRFEVVDIGLDEDFIQDQSSGFKLVNEVDISKIIKPRNPFSHKGTYGHALIVAGAKDTMGAALLCAGASLYTGSGLTTACIPEGGLTALNIRLPEVMAMPRAENFELPVLEKYNAVGIGPGLGTGENAVQLLNAIVTSGIKSIVTDADALNILSKNPDIFKRLPEGTILTPHVKEFDRMFGEHQNWWKRVETARAKAQEYGFIIVLKNRYTFIVLPDGDVLINPTGSPSMATGGMGDVLTGMIVSFLAQGYSPKEAAILAVFIHGYCGQSYEGYVCPASQLCDEIPRVLKYFAELK